MGRKIKMMWIQEVIKRLIEKKSIRSISKELKIHRNVVRKINKLSIQNDWLKYPIVPCEELNKIFINRKEPKLDRFKDKIKDWVEQGFSYVVIHKLISTEIKCGETTLRNYVKNNFQKSSDPIMVRETIPGKNLEID